MDPIKREETLSRLSPCGLFCGKCFAFKGGDISELSAKLSAALGNFEPYAARFVTVLDEPLFADYPAFKALLDYFAQAKCGGCRKEGKCALLKTCKVVNCVRDKQVDFCFQCPNFPCNDTGFDENLNKRSIENNRKIQEMGVEAYYEEMNKKKSRY
ncbi:MAG: DUF3795 domain-containing protein [Deltaproteobacteria bacterium]|jgi:hypothetical protein|nr:DUF3795 domain-containing protein [Deltaproteobacteria bacterium]